VATAVAAICMSAPARAEPVFAMRTGYSCGHCHVNRTGGGMRTTFGSLYGQTIMPARALPWGDGTKLLPANPNARFGYGGDIRVAYFAASSEDFDNSASFEIPGSGLYGLVRLAPQRLELYLDQRVGFGVSASRELFGLWSFRAGHGYLKLGQFIPSYGWALPDDDAFIRGPLGFSFAGPDLGVELGFEPGKWTVQLSVTNGSGTSVDNDTTKRLTLLTARRFRRGRIGLSGSYDRSGGTTTSLAGLFGGMSFGRFSLLAEGDWRRVKPPDQPVSVDTLVGYVEVDLMLTRGMTLKYAHDWIDPNRDVETDRQQRDSLGFEYIPIPFVQLRAFVRRKDGPPQIPGSRDEQAELEVHFYF
jgi:hypothetical protein